MEEHFLMLPNLHVSTPLLMLYHWHYCLTECGLYVDDENRLALGTRCHFLGSFNYFSLLDLSNQKSIIYFQI